MKTWLSIWLVSLALLIAGAWWWHINESDDGTNTMQKSALQDDINACDTITEKAAANLVAVVEAQKLEIIGRKAHVFKLCMADHGYAENPVWTKYAAPVAEDAAKQTKILVDEALENLRREEMVQFTTEKNVPMYWVRVQPSN